MKMPFYKAQDSWQLFLMGHAVLENHACKIPWSGSWDDITFNESQQPP